MTLFVRAHHYNRWMDIPLSNCYSTLLHPMKCFDRKNEQRKVPFLFFLDEVVLSVVIFIVDMGVQINPDCRLVTSRWNFLFKLGHFIHVFGNSQSCVLSSAVMSSFMPSQRLTDKVVLTALTEDEPACDKIMTMWGGHIITISTARGWK